ncbi:DNA-binding protein, CopG family [Xenorhabdus stockiae]|uniref:DNA-binding protein, CopG family n=1 Tax=Xenorhabdus stockiae TaxID=351614 RepID=A0A2D0KAK2_9GAMM|nr:type II toxin-antitoxin system HicB family antitoxin [Xenorhabdus stockiae]PHM60476.1 DNA-binding protein, CopG family [Xenorhabdus stockiae]
MFFSVGVETPKDENTAYGMVVPAFFAHDCACFSAADTQSDIPAMVREAILLTIEEMIYSSDFTVDQLHDAGHLVYAANPEYADFDSWFVIDIDLSEFEGKQQRINVALPDTLIKRIDTRVKQEPMRYRDRSHFIAEAARHELQPD